MASPSSPSLAAKGTSSGSQAPAPSDSELAQAFRDIARGEQTAQALELNLTSLERKLDDFLASFEESEQLKAAVPNGDKAPGDAKSKKP